MATLKLLSTQRMAAIYEPYFTELGRLVYVWEITFMRDLAALFWRTTGIENGDIPLAIWHSERSDLAQHVRILCGPL